MHRDLPDDYQELVDFMDALGFPAGTTEEQFRAAELMETSLGNLPTCVTIISDDYSLLLEDIVGYQRVYTNGRTQYVDEAAGLLLIALNE